jgi:hypothetical protein
MGDEHFFQGAQLRDVQRQRVVGGVDRVDAGQGEVGQGRAG